MIRQFERTCLDVRPSRDIDNAIKRFASYSFVFKVASSIVKNVSIKIFARLLDVES